MDREAATDISAIEQVDRAVAMFARYYRYERIEGMERVQTDRIPLEAFREAVANALVHRTWDVRAIATRIARLDYQPSVFHSNL